MSSGKKVCTPTRREFLLGSASAAFSASTIKPSTAAASTNIALIPEVGAARLLGADKPQTEIWGYGGRVPGPLLRVQQGETLNASLINAIGQPTTVHWHGIRIANSMDGVPGLTQAPVQPGGKFDYSFVCPDAGTYWYHPHKTASEQIARGLHGILIVDELEPPKVDQDLTLVFDDWRLKRDNQIHSESFGSIGERAHGGRYGNVFTLNGSSDYVIDAVAGERLRLRMCNVSNANIFAITIPDHRLTIIAIDGQPVEPVLARSNRIVLATGQRADIIIDLEGAPGNKSPIEVSAFREQFTVGAISYHASERKREQPLEAPIRLKPNPLNTQLDTVSPKNVTLMMEGGAMGRLDGAHIGDKWLSMNELVRQKGFVWALDGHAGMPDKPLFSVKQGQTVVVKMINKTGWPHAMHLHGHHFRALKSSLDAQPQPWWRDTQLIFSHEEVSLAFVADNPGKWMLHCHMLEHHEGGMSTWFEVQA